MNLQDSILYVDVNGRMERVTSIGLANDEGSIEEHKRQGEKVLAVYGTTVFFGEDHANRYP